MKALSMPISSPARPEKSRPPLKRFSRTNAGSRSRSSSRSSPIFYRRNAAGKFEAAQEPYSPKVTCIGQVRAGKSGGAAPSPASRRRCWFVKKALLFGRFLSRVYRWRKTFRRILYKWVVFFKTDYCKKVDDAEKDCFRGRRKIEFFGGKCDYNNNILVRDNGGNSVSDDSSSCSPPPRNALILMRLALGERIWREKGEDGVAPETPKIRQEGGGGGDSLVALRRCKSEPARRGEWF